MEEGDEEVRPITSRPIGDRMQSDYGTNTQSEGALRRKLSQRSEASAVRDSVGANNGAASGNAQQQPQELKKTWWKKTMEKYGSLELENKGSVARDHLALERTFLAWLRTSLAFASIGIAITQLFRLNTSLSNPKVSEPTTSGSHLRMRSLGKPIGATFVGISIVVLFTGFHRYFESQHWIIRGKFPVSRGSVTLIMLITLLLMLASLTVILVVEPRKFER